ERSPERMELRAMCPVNVRAPHEHLKLGNRVSMMVAPLPVGIFDPRERYRQVRAAMAQLKASGQSARMARMVELIDLLPPPLQMVFSWVQMAAAPINTVCTNIPGPPVSLYVQGKRLESLVPLIPLAQGVGLAFAILSYADSLTIGITVDPALVPDSDRFEPLLQACLVIETGIGAERASRVAATAPVAGCFMTSGCAGALVPWLHAGDLVAADRVIPFDAAGRPGGALPAEADGLGAWAAARGFRLHL